MGSFSYEVASRRITLRSLTGCTSTSRRTSSDSTRLFLPTSIRQADIYMAGYGGPTPVVSHRLLMSKSRNGNKRQYDASVSVAPFVSAVQLEGPLVRNRVSIIGSARQSMIRQFAQHYVSQDLPYTFGDAFAKVHMIISPTSQLSVSGLFTHDSGAIGLPSEDRILEEVGWKNYAIGTRYVVLPRALPFVAEVLLSYSRLDTDQGPKGDPVRWSRSEGFSYAVNMTSFYQRAEWALGTLLAGTPNHFAAWRIVPGCGVWL